MLRTTKFLFLLLILCSLAFGQFTSQGTANIQGQFTSPGAATSGALIGPTLFGMHVHTPSQTWPTIPTQQVRIWSTGCQWNAIETSQGVYNFSCLHSWDSLAQTNDVNLMYTVGQLPLFYSEHNPDPGPYNITQIQRTGCPGACTVQIQSDQRINPGVSDTFSFSGIVCPSGDDLTSPPYTLNSKTEGTDSPWTYNFLEGTTNETCTGGTMTDLAQTGTICNASPNSTAPGSCYSPNNISLSGVVTGTDPVIPFIQALIADDVTNDPQHRLQDIECWNEPQGRGYFNGSLSQLATMCIDIYNTVKASSESYIRVHAPPPSAGASSIQTWITAYAAKGSNPYASADVLGYHTYSFGATNAPITDDVLTIATDANTAFGGCAACTGKPVWATEGGWGSPAWATTGQQGPCPLNKFNGSNCVDAGGNFADKAGWVMQSYALHATAGISAFNWFAWDNCSNSGLVTACPPNAQIIGGSGLAYGYAHDWLANANMPTPCAVATNVWTCVLTRSGGYQAELVWDRIDAPAPFVVPAGYTQVRDLSGNVTPAPFSASACGGGAGSICIGYDPQLLETGNSAFQIITTPVLPTATQNQAYSVALTFQNASGTVFCDERTLPSQLPPGMSFGAPNAQTCTVQGSPTATGTFTGILLGAEDGLGNTASAKFSITVNPASMGNADNIYTPWNPSTHSATPSYTGTEPVSFPTRAENSQRVNRPSPGSVVVVGPSSNLQTALNAATCGQTIELTAGATYSGQITFPNLNCSVTNWLTVTTTAAANLPAEGTRISPCYAGVASLPGRSGQYNCPVGGAANITARIQSTGSGALFNMSQNAESFIQFIGIEFHNGCAAPCTSGPLIQLGSQSHDIVFDQMICSGQEMATIPATASNFTETIRCIAHNQSHNIMVVESYVYDMYCIGGNISGATGCQAQAFGTGTGTLFGTNWGNYKWINNFLESAGEVVENGGGLGPGGPGSGNCASLAGGCVDDNPTDFEVRLNHLFRPLSWMPPLTSPGAGYPSVQNIYECKTCERTFLEGNILENVWAGYSQAGYAVLVNPKSQAAGAGVNQCPSCAIHDFIMRYNVVKGMCSTMQIANGTNDNGILAYLGFGYSIHDNLFDNVMMPNAYKCNTGGQVETQLTENITQANPTPGIEVLHNVNINHNTIVVNATPVGTPAGFLGLGGPTAAAGNDMNNIQYQNNLGTQGSSGTINVSGSSSSCAHGVTGAPATSACWNAFPPSVFGGNAIMSATNIWGANNCISETYSGIFVNYNGGNGGDYHVKSTSACHGTALDGTDPGANIDLVNSKTAGVN